MTELGLPKADGQHAQIRMIEGDCAIAVSGDNQEAKALAKALAKNPVMHVRTKHIDI